MPLIVTLTPGTTWTDEDDVTDAKLNLTANPAISVTGSTTDLSNIAAVLPLDGQILVFSTATGKWTPQSLPVANSDAPNRLFMWAHFQ